MQTHGKEPDFLTIKTVNGGPQVKIWIDSGYSCTTVRKDLVHASWLRPGTQRATVASGDIITYGLADITLEVDGQKFPVKAPVANKLPVSELF